MATYKTPGVYVEEISTLPPSVAEVSTAIPAFIGYTEKKPEGINQPARISTFLEYKNLFGGPQKTAFEATINTDGSVATTTPGSSELKYLMYYAVDLYFKNGGGPCYIVSVGEYKLIEEEYQAPEKGPLEAGLTALEKEDEPTLIILPDAVNLDLETDYYNLCDLVLVQCNKLGDRFGIFDVLHTDTDGTNLRNGIRSESEYLKYGAAYTPYLQTSITQQYDENEVMVKNIKSQYRIPDADNKQIKVTYLGDVNSVLPKVIVTGTQVVVVVSKAKRTSKKKKAVAREFGAGINFEINNDLFTITLPEGGALAADIKETWDSWKETNDAKGFDLVNPEAGNIDTDLPETPLERDFTYKTHPNGIEVNHTGPVTTNIPKLTINQGTLAVVTTPADINTNTPAGITITVPLAGAAPEAIADELTAGINGFEIIAIGDKNENVTSSDAVTELPLEISSPTIGLANLKLINTAQYNNVLTALGKEKVIMPPAAAIAGVYATTDRNRGVWKAPANVSIVSVSGPVTEINSQEQENLNVDPVAGKSINAVRSFIGKGTLVWGARTLAGNDNEWRYISTRRLFNTIEESCKKSTQFAVFEPNDANTWLKVKSMIDSYLYGLWQQGALAGAVPEDAYFVNVGLGKTMVSQDILEGRMIVEVGIAAVRPAEFIVLRFSHKLQES